MKQLVATLILLISFNTYADLEGALKEYDFKKADEEARSLIDSKMGYIVQKAGSYVSHYENLYKKIKFEHRTNMTDPCHPSQSDSYHHACLLQLKDSELPGAKTTVDELAGVNSEIQAIDDKVKAHYAKLIDEKTKDIEEKLKKEIEPKIAACPEGKTAEELDQELGCLDKVATSYIGDFFTKNNLAIYKKQVLAGPVVSLVKPRADKANSTKAKLIAAHENSPEGKREALAGTLCRAYWIKMNAEKSIASEKEVGRNSGFVNANHLHQKGTDLRDAKREIASTEPKYNKMTGKKFNYARDCKDERDDEEPEHE